MRKFNEHDFNGWRQDNFDASKIGTIEEYLAFIGNTCTVYCIKELNYTSNEAYIAVDMHLKKEAERLNYKL